MYRHIYTIPFLLLFYALFRGTLSGCSCETGNLIVHTARSYCNYSGKNTLTDNLRCTYAAQGSEAMDAYLKIKTRFNLKTEQIVLLESADVESTVYYEKLECQAIVVNPAFFQSHFPNRQKREIALAMAITHALFHYVNANIFEKANTYSLDRFDDELVCDRKSGEYVAKIVDATNVALITSAFIEETVRLLMNESEFTTVPIPAFERQQAVLMGCMMEFFDKVPSSRKNGEHVQLNGRYAHITGYANGQWAPAASLGPPNGFGWKNDPQMGRLIGFWQHDKLMGQGTIFYDAVSYQFLKYSGELRDNLPDGKGIMYFKNGNIYDGEWKSGTMEGWGCLRFADGSTYMGGFRKGLYNGKGVLYSEDSQKIINTGIWEKGSFLHGF